MSDFSVPRAPGANGRYFNYDMAQMLGLAPPSSNPPAQPKPSLGDVVQRETDAAKRGLGEPLGNAGVDTTGNDATGAGTTDSAAGMASAMGTALGGPVGMIGGLAAAVAAAELGLDPTTSMTSVAAEMMGLSDSTSAAGGPGMGGPGTGHSGSPGGNAGGPPGSGAATSGGSPSSGATGVGSGNDGAPGAPGTPGGSPGPAAAGGGADASGGSSCFLTTAACDVMGLADDCQPLTLMRRFRDETMLPDPALAPLVAHYYATAPSLVRAIAASGEAETVYRRLWTGPLRKAMAAVVAGKSERAVRVYRTMIERLEARYAR